MRTSKIDRTKNWTVDDYVLLGEMNTPCELINGELFMSPAPNPLHQEILSNINDVLKTIAKKVQGKVYFSPIDLYLDFQNVFQPDLVFLAVNRLSMVTDRGIEGVPNLIVEVISPSNIFSDRNTKKRAYLEFGVEEYWIVDPGNRTLEIYTPQAGQEVPKFYLAGEGEVKSSVLPDLKFDLKEIFPNP